MQVPANLFLFKPITLNPAGELAVTYLDEELRVSRGDKGNLFVLRMVSACQGLMLSLCQALRMHLLLRKAAASG